MSVERLHKLSAEHVILVSLLILSSWMFIRSYTFRDPSGLFPRFTAAICILGAIIILSRRYLPAPVVAYIEEDQEMFDTDEISQLKEENQNEDDSPPAEIETETVDQSKVDETEYSFPSATELWNNKTFMLTNFTLGYVLISYLFGFLWASPLFVAVYSVYVKHPRYITIGLTILSFLLVYGFMTALNIGLDTGYLHR